MSQAAVYVLFVLALLIWERTVMRRTHRCPECGGRETKVEGWDKWECPRCETTHE